VSSFRTPRNRNVTFLARRTALLLAAFGLAASLTASMFGQAFARPDGSTSVPIDWSSKHVVFTGDHAQEEALKTWNEPRAYAQWLLHGNATAGWDPVRRGRPRRRIPRMRARGPMRKDWAISLGAGGVAQGMSPAKFSFNVNATPSCAADFVVFPVNASTGNTRANVVGTFTGEPTSAQTTSITVTPTGGTANYPPRLPRTRSIWRPRSIGISAPLQPTASWRLCRELRLRCMRSPQAVALR
jgi:hypothetical protein